MPGSHGVFDGATTLAIAAGMAATVNPCGFALLPAYLSMFLGSDHRAGGTAAIGRALAVSAAVTAGFVVVFGLFGAVVAPLAVSFDRQLPWVTIVIGIGLVVLGGVILSGRQPTVSIPKLQRGGSDGTLPSMFLFGMSYAIASLSCTIGPFLAVTTTTFRSSNVFAGLVVFVAYAVGMGIVITMLTVATAMARSTVVGRFRRALPVINRAAGALVVLAGVYVAYYGWYEVRVQRGATSDPLIDRAAAIQGWLTEVVVPDRPGRAALVALAVMALIAATLAVSRRRRAGVASGTTPVDEPEHANVVT
jgi:cytochrome c biogenesis protein CcdA